MFPIKKYQIRETSVTGKSFAGESRKYFSAHQYQSFRKIGHQSSAIEQNRFIQRKKIFIEKILCEFQKQSSRQRYSVEKENKLKIHKKEKKRRFRHRSFLV